MSDTANGWPDPARETLEWALAIHFSRNRQPCMSGDPRDRLSSLERRNLSAAAQAALDALDPVVAVLVEAARRDERERMANEVRCEAEQERDEFSNMLDRITSELGLPVDVTAGRIIEAIYDLVDAEREACASVSVTVTVPDGAENWTPLEAWEEALIASDEAFRAAIRAR